MIKDMKIPCVGGQHHQLHAAGTMGLLVVGSQVDLRPEPQNPYDKNAIEVFTQERAETETTAHVPPMKLGYIAKNFAAGLSPDMLKGMKLIATIELVRNNSVMLNVSQPEESGDGQEKV